MIEILSSLHSDKNGNLVGTYLEKTIGGLSSAALGNDEVALRILIECGTNIANHIAILWSAPDFTIRRQLFKKIAAERTEFPVNFDSQRGKNQAWEDMVKKLGLGSAGPLRTDRYKKKDRTFLESLVMACLHTYEALKDTPEKLPPEWRGAPPLVAEHSADLASRIVKTYLRSDSGFSKLRAWDQPDKPFALFGRNFEKRKDSKKAALKNKRKRSNANESVSKPRTAAKEKEYREADNQYWKDLEARALKEMSMTDADIRADLTEAITSILQSLLRSSPGKTA